nr:MAG TPA: hypothetical protein [Caudoviricetes sp.]
MYSIILFAFCQGLFYFFRNYLTVLISYDIISIKEVRQWQE